VTAWLIIIIIIIIIHTHTHKLSVRASLDTYRIIPVLVLQGNEWTTLWAL